MKFNSAPISQSRETCRRLNALMKIIKFSKNKNGKSKTKIIKKSRKSRQVYNSDNNLEKRNYNHELKFNQVDHRTVR